MARREHTLGIDEGTTGVRAVVLHASGTVIGEAYREIGQRFPEPGWVEHDPAEVWQRTQAVVAGALEQGRGKLVDDVAGTSDELTEKYLTEGDLTQEELDQGLRDAVREGKVVPVYFASGTRPSGIAALLGQTLAGNRDMLALAQRLGFALEAPQDGVVNLTLQLA